MKANQQCSFFTLSVVLLSFFAFVVVVCFDFLLICSGLFETLLLSSLFHHSFTTFPLLPLRLSHFQSPLQMFFPSLSDSVFSPSHSTDLFSCFVDRCVLLVFGGLPQAVVVAAAAAAAVFYSSSRVMVSVVLSSLFLHNHPRWGISCLSFPPAFVYCCHCAFLLLLLPSLFFWFVVLSYLFSLFFFSFFFFVASRREKFYSFAHTCSDLSFGTFLCALSI